MFTKWLMGNSSEAREEVRAEGRAGRRMLRMAGISMLALTVAFAGGCSLLPDEGEEEVLPEITPPQISKKPEYEVTTTTLDTKVTAIGKLMSEEEETLFFTLEGKRLMTLDVKPGDVVKAGQLIAELDVEDMRKDLRQKRLQFRKAEASMKETLRKRDEMDPIEFEEASIAFEEQRQSIVDLEAEIAKASITAPFSGTVVQVHVKKGDLIKAYDPIAIIADTSRLVVTAEIGKQDLERVAVGMPAVVDITGAGQFEGKVSHLPVAGSNDGNNNGNPGQGQEEPKRPSDYMQVDIGEMPEGAGRGMPLSATVIINRKENAIVIPPSALRSIGSRTYVQIVDENGSKREVDVAVGQQTPTQVEILEGLTPGQKVVGR